MYLGPVSTTHYAPSPPRDLVALPPVGIDEAEDDWRRLAAEAGTPFATWEWAAAWWRHYGDGRALRVVPVRGADGGPPIALVPLYLHARRPLRVLRFVGNGPADELGPVCAPEAAGPALEAALASLGRGWDLLWADHLPADGAPARLGRPLKVEASPSLELPEGGFEEYLAARSRNFREQVRRRERKLGRAHELSYRLVEDEAGLPAAMETLFELHGARWEDDASSAFDATRRAFHVDFAARALRRGWLRLWLLELDGRPAAAWYGFRYGGAEWYYQSGRDPQHESDAVGFVLMAHTVRAASDDGLRVYRLLRGGEAYKSRFATSDRPVATVAISRGARGRPAAAALERLAQVDPERRRRALGRLRAAAGRGR
jgi:CelD/BcsL family acetyltransferase involved in cellulose biosynthesis